VIGAWIGAKPEKQFLCWHLRSQKVIGRKSLVIGGKSLAIGGKSFTLTPKISFLFQLLGDFNEVN
jgi:hypothetical protein